MESDPQFTQINFSNHALAVKTTLVQDPWLGRIFSDVQPPWSAEGEFQRQRTKVMNQKPQILIGPGADRPVFALQESEAWGEFRKGGVVERDSSVIGRVLSALQSVPDILLAGSMASKKLMEVEIHGDLTRAADGVGYRAFAVGDHGIKEHARLFDADNLNTLVDAAAIWRIASVVVAQKYLHDINQNLNEIKSALHAVGQFQRDEQRSKIESSVRDFSNVCHWKSMACRPIASR